MTQNDRTDNFPGLLPCPFCGGKAVFGRVDDNESDANSGGEFIDCSGCLVSTALVFPLKGDVKRELSERWNRRPSGDAMLELRAQGWRWQEYAEHLEHCVECGLTSADSCHEGGQLRAAARGEAQPDD